MTYDSFEAVSWLSEFLLGAGRVPGTSLPYSSCRPVRPGVPLQEASPPGAVLNKQRNASPSQNSLGSPSAAEVFFD